MKMASDAKKLASLPIRSSAANFEANALSANLKSNGADGISFLKIAAIFATDSLALLLGFNFMIIQFTFS